MFSLCNASLDLSKYLDISDNSPGSTKYVLIRMICLSLAFTVFILETLFLRSTYSFLYNTNSTKSTTPKKHSKAGG